MNPSDTAARVNKGFAVGHAGFTPTQIEALTQLDEIFRNMRTERESATPRTDAAMFLRDDANLVTAHFARALETELNTLANHPSDEVNRRYIVPLQVAYTHAMAQRDQLREALKKCDNAFVGWQLGQIPGRPEDILALITEVRAAIHVTQPSP